MQNGFITFMVLANLTLLSCFVLGYQIGRAKAYYECMGKVKITVLPFNKRKHEND